MNTMKTVPVNAIPPRFDTLEKAKQFMAGLASNGVANYSLAVSSHKREGSKLVWNKAYELARYELRYMIEERLMHS